ncbi:MAG: helix-turn-helix domain-containing protein [Thermodesulfobacteriota bacterium]
MCNRWNPDTVIPEVDKSDRFLTVPDVASLLSIRPSTVYQWVSSEEIPHYRLGRILRFKRKDLEVWVEGFRKERVDDKKRAREILRPPRRKAQDIDRIIEKSIAEAKGNRYTPAQEKPGEDKGLRKEAEHGFVS